MLTVLERKPVRDSCLGKYVLGGKEQKRWWTERWLMADCFKTVILTWQSVPRLTVSAVGLQPRSGAAADVGGRETAASSGRRRRTLQPKPAPSVTSPRHWLDPSSSTRRPAPSLICSGGLVYWATVSRDIISKRYLHYSSSRSSRRTKHAPAVSSLPRSRFPMRTTRLLAAISLFMTSLRWEDRQRQLQPQHLTEQHRRCLFVFYRREPCSPVANVKHFPIKADSYYHRIVGVSLQPFTFSALQVWGGGHIMQSSQPVMSGEIEPRAKKMHLRHKMTSEFHSAVQPD